LSSIDFSGLTSLSNVDEYWLSTFEGTNGYMNLSSIYVGNLEFKENFSQNGFGDYLPTSAGHSIYANSYPIASTWQKGGISSWNADISDELCSFYTLSSDSTTHIYFDEANTNINNFCAASGTYEDGYITINDEEIHVQDICSLNFGVSYGDVEEIDDYFIYGIKNYFYNLSSISFAGLSSLTTVGNSWMDVGGDWQGFPSLTSISFEGMNSLTTVGDDWMNGGNVGGFDSLMSINFSGLNSLTTVGNNWMKATGSGVFSSLTTLGFSGLSSLNSVGNHWMDSTNNSGFLNLSSIDFSGLSSLTTVGDDWMHGKDALGFSKMAHISVGNVTYPSYVGDNFCDDWPEDGLITGAACNSWQNGGISNWSI